MNYSFRILQVFVLLTSFAAPAGNAAQPAVSIRNERLKVSLESGKLALTEVSGGKHSPWPR